MEENLPTSEQKNYLIIGSVLVLIVVVVSYFVFSKEDQKPLPPKANVSVTPTPKPTIKADTSTKGKTMTVDEKLAVTKPEMLIDQSKKYTAIIKTSVGDIELDLNASETPATVNNFVYLARIGFYNDVIFHRVIDGFMIQGGDPLGTGTGGPNYKFADEKFSGEYKRGTIAMANAGPNTNGSQFFIMHADYALPKNYTIFGQATKGLDIVDKIATAETKQSGEGSSPVSPVKILGVEIVEK